MRQKTARRWRAEEQSHTERLESLLQRVLSSPVNHKGVRTLRGDIPRRYTAIRINDDLLEEIRKEAQ